MPQFKKFTAETVEVSEMNDYIASQVVGTFDSAAARSAYFGGGGAFSVTEGMVTYLKDTGEFQVYKSTGWTTIGATGSTGATGATGASGATGSTGATGSAGAAASITLGAVTTGEPGSSASVTNSGSSSAAVFNFAIPRGLTGPAGVAGSNGATGATGATGAEGPRGDAATINVGSVARGDTAQVTNAGNTTDAVFNFVLPKGDTGSLAVGTVTTGAAGTAASVTNSGTSTSAVLDFTIPQGAAGTGDVTSTVANTFTTNQIISGSSASALLRITQTGAGNALVVEDSANPDSTPFVVDPSGYVGIGTTTPYTPAGYAALTLDGSGGHIISGRIAGTETFRIQSTVSSTTINNIANLPMLFNTNNVERMRIDSTGQVGIGATPAAGRTLTITKAVTGATTSVVVLSNGAIQSDVTSDASSFRSGLNTAAAAFTVATLQHFMAAPASATPGAGSTITTQIGFGATGTLTGATNNFGFYGDIAASTGRWNLYMNGTAANYMAGRLGVGATLTTGAMAMVVNTTAADVGLIVRGAASQSGSLVSIQNSAASALVTISSSGDFAVTSNTTSTAPFQINAGLSGGTSAYSVLVQSVIASGVTVAADAFRTSWSTAAAAFTLTTARHFTATGMTIGAASTVTNQIGFLASALTGATNNFGFVGEMGASTGRWNLYMSGTAANHLAGNLCVGTTAIATSADKAIHMGNGTAPSANIASGGILYVESGALKYRGSSGTVTTLGAA